MNRISYAKSLLDIIIDMLSCKCRDDLLNRFHYLKNNILFYEIQENSQEEDVFLTETVITHQNREANLVTRTHFCHFPPEKINDKYEELKSIIVLSEISENELSHVIIHELVHLLSSQRYHIDKNVLTKKVGINTYIYQCISDQYKKNHIIYDITNELITDYIADVFNQRITGKQIPTEKRCFAQLSFDNFINLQLAINHIELDTFIQRYIGNDLEFIETLLNCKLKQFEERCLSSFHHHQPLL